MAAAGCVRQTVEDATAEGFRPIVVRKAVGDRVPGVVALNLFDIDAKFGDVEPLENVIQDLDNLSGFADTVPTSAIPIRPRLPRGLIGSSRHGAVADLPGRAVACPQQVVGWPPARDGMSIVR